MYSRELWGGRQNGAAVSSARVRERCGIAIHGNQSWERDRAVVARLEPWKIPKCLENGSFWDQKRVKNGSKTCFS